ncbi:TPA: glycosyltransferase [Klebsiella pneumoniae]|nr:glycosyltransferase [Klebsiella pneumoniae]
MIDVSVILPIYNIQEEYLEKCLNSIVSQTKKNIEIILVNDGSTNNCLDVCLRYQSNDSRVKVINQSNEGVSVARNKGLDQAVGRWIAFVDPDDWLETTYLETLWGATNDNMDIILCDCFVNTPKAEYKNHFLPPDITGTVKEKNTLLAQLVSKVLGGYFPPHVAAGVPWGKLFRKDFLEQYNLRYIPKMVRMQDNIFCLYAIHYASGISYIPETLYHYRKETQSASFKYTNNIIEYFEKYFFEVSKFIKTCLNNDLEYNKALDAKIITSINSYFKYYFFHNKNPLTYKDVKHEFNSLISKELYYSAIKNVDLSYLNTKEKLFYFLIKMKLLRILKIAYKF